VSDHESVVSGAVSEGCYARHVVSRRRCRESRVTDVEMPMAKGVPGSAYREQPNLIALDLT
jgi:hypothetical protein